MSSTAMSPSEAVALPKPTADDGDDNVEPIKLEERLAAEEFISREKALLEKKHLFQQLKRSNQKSNALSGGDRAEKPDLRPMKAASMMDTAAPEGEDSCKLTEMGIHSLTHSVTDEFSRPMSEVEDDPHSDETEVSSENMFHGLRPSSRHGDNVGRDPTKNEGRTLTQGSLEVDEFEGAIGEIDSVGDEKCRTPHSEELRVRTSSPFEAPREGDEEQKNEDGEVFQASQELPDEQQPTEMSGQHYPLESDSEEFSTNQNNSEEKQTFDTDAEVDDASSNLGTLEAEPRTGDEEFTPQTRLDSEIILFYPQQLDPEDVINPFSLEVRIRKAREQQDISLEWEAGTIAENIVGNSKPQANLESRSILPDLKEISPDEPTESSDKAVKDGIHSRVKERVRTGAVPGGLVDPAKEVSETKPGVGEAVLLGALASGVNGPTWFVVRAVLVALVASLLLLLHVAIKSDSWFVLLNVLFLIFIAGGLILLLGWYISQIGLVSVENQMVELNLGSEPQKVESKTL